MLRLAICRLLALSVALSSLACGDGASRPPVDSPNIILFLADDQGWTGTSVLMDPDVPESRSDYYLTPSLEKFAQQGLRFSNAYAAASICSPSRASIQTGKSPAALHMTGVLASPRPPSKPKPLVEPALSTGLPLSELTYAEAIRNARPDYVTAYVGKWHLGPHGPGEQGYMFHHPGNENPHQATDVALDFIREQAESQKHFVLQISHYAIHKGFPPSDQAIAAVRWLHRGTRHRNDLVAAMTLDLDADFGRVLDLLAELGIEEQTYVFYTSDNGAYDDITNNYPLSKGKFSAHEGGIRVPFIVRGPGVPMGAVTDTPVIGWDLLPTILDLLGVDSPPATEGGSLLPILDAVPDAKVVRPREELVWHYPHYYHLLGGSRPHSAIRIGPNKLYVDYESRSAELFDLRTDLGERHDLSKQEPELAAELQARLRHYLRAVDAQMAVPRTPEPEAPSS